MGWNILNSITKGNGATVRKKDYTSVFAKTFLFCGRNGFHIIHLSWRKYRRILYKTIYVISPYSIQVSGRSGKSKIWFAYTDPHEAPLCSVKLARKRIVFCSRRENREQKCAYRFLKPTQAPINVVVMYDSSINNYPLQVMICDHDYPQCNTYVDNIFGFNDNKCIELHTPN